MINILSIRKLKKTHILEQQIKNITEIKTIYKIDNYDVILDLYTGTPEKVLGIKEAKSGLTVGEIIVIVFGSIIGVTLIAFIIYFLTKKNKLKI